MGYDYESFQQYDYEKNVREDIKEYLQGNEDRLKSMTYDEIYDELWTADSVTGNGSGSYTFSRYKAEINLCGNTELLADACEEFCCDASILKDGAEACDVTIRCYLLGQYLSEVLDELGWMEDDDEDEDDEEEEDDPCEFECQLDGVEANEKWSDCDSCPYNKEEEK